MRYVFEPDEIALADSQGDPNRAVEIQKLVQELLSANPNRQDGISDEILDHGAWAMPGLINATYVWMTNFEQDRVARHLIIEIMKELAQSNDAAAKLLYKAGILEMPFAMPRSMAREALLASSWAPTPDDILRLKGQVDYYRNMGDVSSIADLYALAAYLRMDSEFPAMLNACCRIIETTWGNALDLLSALVQAYPECAEEILEAVIEAVKKAHSEGYKDKNIARKIIDALRPVPGSWVRDGMLVHLSARLLSSLWPPRHTVIEYLWQEAVKSFYNEAAVAWPMQRDEVGDQIRDACEQLADAPASSLCRYWLIAVADVNDIDYVIEQAQASQHLWAIQSIVELFFLTSRSGRLGSQAQQALRDLETRNPNRYAIALEQYEVISGNRKPRTDLQIETGPAGMRL
jgi:hypothetical protein